LPRRPAFVNPDLLEGQTGPFAKIELDQIVAVSRVRSSGLA
jgi:hypothetical protein